MGVVYAVNPSRRKKRAKSRRKASPAQLAARKRFAAMARARSSTPKRRRSRRAVAVLSNPAPRRRRVRRSSAVARRRIRRNPVSMGSMKSTFRNLSGMVMNAAVGGAGAIAIDITMAQAIKALPVSMASRYTAEGGINFGYFAAKSAIAVGLGMLAGAVVPSRMRQYVNQAVEGSLTVQAYEIERALLPAELTLGYYNPGRVATRPRAMKGMGAYARIAPPSAQVMNMPQRRAMAGISSQGNSAAKIG